jgi:hypothetical protein
VCWLLSSLAPGPGIPLLGYLGLSICYLVSRVRGLSPRATAVNFRPPVDRALLGNKKPLDLFRPRGADAIALVYNAGKKRNLPTCLFLGRSDHIPIAPGGPSPAPGLRLDDAVAWVNRNSNSRSCFFLSVQRLPVLFVAVFYFSSCTSFLDKDGRCTRNITATNRGVKVF